MKKTILLIAFLVIPLSGFCSYRENNDDLIKILENYDQHFANKTMITIGLLNQTRDNNEKKILKTNLKITFLCILDKIKREIQLYEEKIASGKIPPRSLQDYKKNLENKKRDYAAIEDTMQSVLGSK